MLQKISPILPSSPRITSVDMSAERPVRRGGADFGLPVAERSMAADRSLNAIDRVNILKETQRVAAAEKAEKSGESSRAISERANREFFEEHGAANERERLENMENVGAVRGGYHRSESGPSLVNARAVSIKA